MSVHVSVFLQEDMQHILVEITSFRDSSTGSKRDIWASENRAKLLQHFAMVQVGEKSLIRSSNMTAFYVLFKASSMVA